MGLPCGERGPPPLDHPAVAFADHDEWLTDPDHVDIPLERLLDREYAAERRALIDRAARSRLGRSSPGCASVPTCTGALQRG
ncbi:MAG: hypothetical protein ACRELX_14035 [Longimicrobiales bacterium]